MTFTIRYNRTTNHIDGLQIRSTGSEMNYSKSACGALSRRGFQMAEGQKFETVAEALKSAGHSHRKLCVKCEEAAKAML